MIKLRILLLAGLFAAPLAAQVPAPDPLLAREGIDAPLPEGFAPMMVAERETGDPGVRRYDSRGRNGWIYFTMVDASIPWRPDDLGQRRDYLDFLVSYLGPRSGEGVRLDDQDEHLVASWRETSPSGEQVVARIYLARTGAPRAVSIVAAYRRGAGDPAADSALLAFLDAAGPRYDDGRSAAQVTFREAGVEMVFAPGITRLLDFGEREEGQRAWGVQNGDRFLIVLVIENAERGASEWPPERRVRHMERMAGRALPEIGGRSLRPVQVTDGVAWRDLQFTEVDPMGRVQGRGRVYTPQSGRAVVVVVVYYEDGVERLVDELAVQAMLDSVRIHPVVTP